VADQLSIYNLALGHLRERRVASLQEQREPVRVLNDFFPASTASCLERHFWKFGKRVVSIDASTTMIPSFGWKYAFNIPEDRVRNYLISTVETLILPLWDYAEEAGYLYANFTPIFLVYISNDAEYGMNLGAWTQSFTDYVALNLAVRACNRLSEKADLLAGPDGLIKREKQARLVAASMDAMNDPPGQMPTGTWSRSRRGFLRGTPLPGGTSYDD
jgi:hypothetical protein